MNYTSQPRTLGTRLLALGLLASLLLGSGCSSVPSRSRREQGILPPDVSPSMVRIAANNFTHRFVQTVEQAADAILRQTADPTIQRRALLWKINATSAVLVAQDHPAPLSALADTFALCLQMHDFFRDGRGGNLFGAHQPIAVTAALQLEQDMEAISQEPTTEEIARLKERLRSWAREHPLEDLTFVRFSGAAEIDAMLSTLDGLGVMASVQNLETEMYTFHTKLARYLGLVPRQVRWQAELLALDALEDDRTGLVAAATRELDRQRDLALADIDRQRTQALAVLREERIAVMEAVAHEREVVVQEARKVLTESLDRIDALALRLEHETLAAVQRQRLETLEALRQERVATMTDLGRIARGTVDHAHARSLGLLAGAWCGLAALLVLARWLFRPRRQSPVNGSEPPSSPTPESKGPGSIASTSPRPS